MCGGVGRKVGVDDGGDLCEGFGDVVFDGFE